MAMPTKRDAASAVVTPRRFVRGVAPGVSERHEHACGLSRGLRRGQCTCSPSYWARATDRRGTRQLATLHTIAEAVAWVDATKNGSRLVESGVSAHVPATREAMTVWDASRWFLERAVRGELVNRSGARYSEATLRSYEVQLRRRVLPFVVPSSGQLLGSLSLDRMTTRIAQSLANQVATTASAATTRIAIAALQSVLREAYEAGMTESEPPRRLRLPSPSKPRQRVLSLQEVDELLDAARDDDARFDRSFAYPLFRLLSTTGARVSELLQLDWGPNGLDLAASPPVMRIGASKTSAGLRDVWLDADTAAILRDHRKATPHAGEGTPVFRRRDGERATRSGITRACIQRVAESAEVPSVSPHVFRHTHVTQLVADGASIVDIAARVGHADARHTLSLYAKPTDAGQARIMRLLETRR